MDNKLLRNLPKVDDVMRSEAIAPIDRDILREIVNEEIQRFRDELRRESYQATDSADVKGQIFRDVSDRVARRVEHLITPSLRRVINGTGVLLHTNLGRSLVRTEGLEELLSGYCNLEISIESGERGDRNAHVSELLRRITGCEAAIAVNNNAAAVMLVLTALAHERTVVVSRGEQVEIGGSFRIPDVAALSGAHITEVGTTNVTRAQDYQRALSASGDAAMILRVEPSNFAVIGQSSRPKHAELFDLAKQFDIPYYVDLGSGVLDPSLLHGAIEPAYIEGKNIKSLIGSADLLSFSADKLIGSTQAGLIVGKKVWIDRLKRHPLYRAMRLDKATIQILCNTLIDAVRGIPTPLSEMLTVSVDALTCRVHDFQASLADAGLPSSLQLRGAEMISAVGGGTFAHTSLPSYGLELSSSALSAEEIASKLRQADVPVVATIERDVVRIDFRTILAQDELPLRAAILSLAQSFRS